MQVYRIIVKESTHYKAMKICRNRGIQKVSLTSQQPSSKDTILRVWNKEEDIEDLLSSWFIEDEEPPFPNGSLLHYSRERSRNLKEEITEKLKSYVAYNDSDIDRIAGVMSLTFPETDGGEILCLVAEYFVQRG